MEAPPLGRGGGVVAGRLSAKIVLTCASLALLAVALCIGTSPAQATPEFGTETGKDCGYCHVSPGGPLSSEGEAFRDNDFKLPPTTQDTAATDTTTVETSGNGASSTAGGPVLSYGRWQRTILLWAHILAVIAWLGGIISVFVVQTPQVAAAGIPRGYLRLAWPALIVVGITGVLLTLGAVSSVGAFSQSRWGALLLAKIGIYAVLLVIALMATFVISPKLARLAHMHPRRTRSQEQFKAQGRVTVLYRGRVYDVTGSRLWPEGSHVRRHEAWQDLTDALAGAPHGPEVLQRFTLVEDAGEDRPPLVMRAYLAMAYASFFLALAVVVVVAAW